MLQSAAMKPHESPLRQAGVQNTALDPYQTKALEILEGPLLMTAGPGSGKTRVLIQRAAHLIQTGRAKPEECLVLTVTRRAAQEAKDRLQKLLPEKWKQIPVMTFQGLGFKILQDEPSEAGLPRNFRIASDRERLELLKEKLSFSETKAEKILREISFFKRAPKTAKAAEAGTLKNALKILVQARGTQGWLDYDDLMIESVRLLEEKNALRSRYRQKFSFVSIDDYQEIDSLQHRLLQLLVPADGNLLAAGDPDQSMDRFRGAEAEFLLRFKTDFPGAREIHLFRNYRSGEILVSASHQVIAPEALVKDREMESLLDDPGKILIHESPTDKEEADYIARCIGQMIGGLSFYSIATKRTDSALERDFSFSDFAVLYRTEAQAILLEESLEQAEIPFERRSRRSLGEHPRVQAYLTLMKQSPAKEGLLDALHQARQKLQESSLEAKDGVYEKLEAIALRAGEKKETFLSEVYLGEDLELWDPKNGKVLLLALHAVKGLEFPAVFIAGCEKGLIPFLPEGEISEEALAEERRLFYTGMARAKERLILSHAQKRFLGGKSQAREASPFLKDIDTKLLEKSKALFKEKRKNPQMELF